MIQKWFFKAFSLSDKEHLAELTKGTQQLSSQVEDLQGVSHTYACLPQLPALWVESRDCSC